MVTELLLALNSLEIKRLGKNFYDYEKGKSDEQ